MTLLAVCACGRTASIDTGMPAEEQARRLTESATPAEVAGGLVRWMSEASASDRAYARALTREIVSIYDDRHSGEARAFAAAVDSIKETLPDGRKARVLVVALRPAHLGSVMRHEAASEDLVGEIRRCLADDEEALEAFERAYNPY